MGEAIGEMLPAAVAVAISPLPIIAIVLILVSTRGRVNGVAYLTGQIIGIAGGRDRWLVQLEARVYHLGTLEQAEIA